MSQLRRQELVASEYTAISFENTELNINTLLVTVLHARIRQAQNKNIRCPNVVQSIHLF
jgi:hypothetical protein